MMFIIGILLFLLGLAMAVAGFIGIFAPKLLKDRKTGEIHTRGFWAKSLALGLAMFVGGALLMGDDDEAKQTAADIGKVIGILPTSLGGVVKAGAILSAAPSILFATFGASAKATPESATSITARNFFINHSITILQIFNVNLFLKPRTKCKNIFSANVNTTSASNTIFCQHNWAIFRLAVQGNA